MPIFGDELLDLERPAFRLLRLLKGESYENIDCELPYRDQFIGLSCEEFLQIESRIHVPARLSTMGYR